MLRGVQADELAKIKLLAQLVSEMADTDRPDRPQTAQKGIDSDLDSHSSLGDESRGATTETCNQDGCS